MIILTDRERQVLEMRNRGMTNIEIARSLGVTRERVRQVEAKALREIQKARSSEEVIE